MEPYLFDQKNINVARGIDRYRKMAIGLMMFVMLMLMACSSIFLASAGMQKVLINKFGTATTATVTNKTVSSSRRSKTYKVAYKYEFAGKQMHETEQINRTTYDKMHVGDQVPIKAITFWPYSALVPADTNIFFGLIAILILAAGLWMLISSIRRKNRLHNHGQLAYGYVVNQNVGVRGKGGIPVTYMYEFRTPYGNIIRHKKIVSYRSKPEIPNLINAPIVVVYADEKTYDVL